MTDPVMPAIDPVCLAKLDAAGSPYQTRYGQGLHHFCSRHCLERFLEAPRYFTAPHPIAEIRPLPRRHRLKVAGATDDLLQAAAGQLRQIQGVAEVSVSPGTLDVAYDLRRVCLTQLEVAVEDAGLQLGGGWHGIRRNLWRFAEHNELDNLANVHPPCCSRPPTRTR